MIGVPRNSIRLRPPCRPTRDSEEAGAFFIHDEGSPSFGLREDRISESQPAVLSSSRCGVDSYSRPRLVSRASIHIAQVFVTLRRQSR